MDRDLWSGLAVFETIVEAGSFARAATRLGLSASALSHAMRSLETKLGVRLLDRTTRPLAPTPAGEELLARLRPAIASVAGALADLDNARERPAGRIRVSAHRVAAIYAILPRLAEFARAYPDIAVELVVDDGFVDIVGVNDKGIPIILGLVDQVHGLRRALGEVLVVLRAQPANARERFAAELPVVRRERDG